jgi:hypothetical protein
MGVIANKKRLIKQNGIGKGFELPQNSLTSQVIAELLTAHI